jgi:two-component system chemotaxis response regulator CheB
MAHVREELTQKIRSVARRETPAALLFPPLPVKIAKRSRVGVLAVGTSTGGPNALAEFIPALPGDLEVPVVIVQHMPPLFTRLLAERLSAKSSLPVHEGEAGRRLEPGHIWIAPGDYHMTVVRRAEGVFLDLNQDSPENFCRPAVDVLFRSVAGAYGPEVLAVVLTGMGSDGARGARVIREAGGEVFAQDEPTSVVWGMPGSVVNAGLANQVLPLSTMGREVVSRIAVSAAGSGTAAALAAGAGSSFRWH